jgi:hypothetical protein
MHRLALVLAAGLTAGLAGSCGLIDESIDDFPLGFPRKPFTVDTASWNLTVQGDTFPSFPCGAPSDCDAAAGQVCSGGECTATCVESACQAHVPVSLFESFNLAVDAPEYQTIDDQTAIDVTVDTVEFEVEVNTMNVPVPILEVYMAPIDVTTPDGTGALLIGTVPSVTPGQTGTISLQIDDGGRTNLEFFMSNFRTPFNVIVAATVDISAGDPVPQGMLQGYVKVAAHADAI